MIHTDSEHDNDSTDVQTKREADRRTEKYYRRQRFY